MPPQPTWRSWRPPPPPSEPVKATGQKTSPTSVDLDISSLISRSGSSKQKISTTSKRRSAPAQEAPKTSPSSSAKDSPSAKVSIKALNHDHLKSRVPTRRAASSHTNRHTNLHERDSWLTGTVSNGMAAYRHHPSNHESIVKFNQSSSKASIQEKQKLVNRQLNWNEHHHTSSQKLPGYMDKYQHHKMEVVAHGSRKAIVHRTSDLDEEPMRRRITPFGHLETKGQQIKSKEAGFGLASKSGKKSPKKGTVSLTDTPPSPKVEPNGFTTQVLCNRRKNSTWTVPASNKSRSIVREPRKSGLTSLASDGRSSINSSSDGLNSTVPGSDDQSSLDSSHSDVQECLTAMRNAGLTSSQMHEILDDIIGHDGAVDKKTVLAAIESFVPAQKPIAKRASEKEGGNVRTPPTMRNKEKRHEPVPKPGEEKQRSMAPASTPKKAKERSPRKQSISWYVVSAVNDTFEFSFPQDREIRDVMSQPGQVKQSIKEAWATSALHEEKERLEQRNKKQSTVKGATAHSGVSAPPTTPKAEPAENLRALSELESAAAQLLKYEAKEHIKSARKAANKGAAEALAGVSPRPRKVLFSKKLGIRLRNKSAAAYQNYRRNV